MTSQRSHHLTEIFDSHKNKEGKIEKSKLANILIQSNIEEKLAQEIAQDAQPDADGMITEEEFNSVIVAGDLVLEMQKSMEEGIRQELRKFDSGDGYISVAELTTVLKQFGDDVTEEDVEELLQQVERHPTTKKVPYEAVLQAIMK